MLELTPDELLTTTRTLRRRLDFNRPVPRELFVECIDVALQAPTGGSKQNWHWILIGDPDVRKQVAEVYRKAWNSDKDHGALHPRLPGDQRRDRIGQVLESGEYLEVIHRDRW